MKTYLLRTQMQIPVSVREAFTAFADPAILERITPAWLRLRVLNPHLPLCKDAELEYAFRCLNLPLRWKARIIEYEPPFFLVDEMIRGPFAFWRHLHNFHPSEHGAIVTDEVEYRIGWGWAGAIAHRFVVAAQLKEIFTFRQIALNEILCGGKALWIEPSITEKPPQSPPSGTANPETRTPVA